MSGRAGVRARAIRRAIALAVGVLGASVIGTATAAAAPVANGHSGWFWGSPQPQGNNLVDLDFVGGRGYAVGDFGTLLRSDDGGASWIGLRTGLLTSLTEVEVTAPDTVTVAGGCALHRSTDGGATFTRMPWTASDSSCQSEIASFHFPSPLVGYLVTVDGSVFRTTDGGQTFSRQTSIPGTPSAGGSRQPTDMRFTSETTGVAVTAGSAGGKVFRTTDSGNSWTDTATAGELTSVTFTSPTDGVAVGLSNNFLATSDGGATWSPKPLAGAPVQGLVSVDCTDALLCLMVGSTGRIVRTADGGATASEITPATPGLESVAFASAARAVAVGQRGTTVTSDDGGVTYAPVGSRLNVASVGELRADSPQTASVGVGAGILARTVDGGINWATVGVPSTAQITDASFPSPPVGFALDAAGGLFKTVNGGSSWQILDPGASRAPSAVFAPSPETVILVGPKSVRRSTDGGTSFAGVTDRDLERIGLDHVERAGGAIVAFGRKAIRISTNAGATWSRIRLPKKADVEDASFVSARAGYVLTRDGRVFKTTNRGERWRLLNALGTRSAYALSFSGPAAGYALISGSAGGPSTLALRTTDGGASWQPQVISGSGLADIADAGPTGFAVGAEPDFFATTTGGEAAAASTLTVAQQKGPKARAKVGKIKVSGELNPAEGGELIEIHYLDGRRWRHRTEVAASNGSFTSSFKLKKPGIVVASWLGDDTRAGAGSRAVTVKPPKPSGK